MRSLKFLYLYLMQEDLINQQIQELTHKQHIDNIQTVKQHQYQVSYSPQLTNSPYSHLTYTLLIDLPQEYPEHPPRLHFLQKIYHLNVDPQSGEVSMPLLSEDWSPFLTLAAVFDSLDNLLQQPDTDFAVSKALKEEYLNQPEKYLQRIQQTIRAASNDFILLNNSQSVVEHVEIIGESKLNEKILSNSLSKSEQIQFLRNSEDLSQIPKQKENAQLQVPIKGQEIKIESASSCPSECVQVPDSKPFVNEAKNEQEFGSKMNKKASLAVELPSSIKAPSKKLNTSEQSSRRAFKQSDDIQLPSTSEFEKVRLSLTQADQMMQLLMAENAQMDETLKRVASGRLREKLLEKQNRILEMIEQTLELSSSLREKLFEKLKADTKSLLR